MLCHAELLKQVMPCYVLQYSTSQYNAVQCYAMLISLDSTGHFSSIKNVVFVLFFSWYPPGHGDLYESFHRSGLLQQFIDAGKEFCFVSNIDNLGATVDVRILS